jgi:hypothetical protein
MPKGNPAKRALEIHKMFQDGPVTCRMIADRFGIKRKSAQGWIDNFSLFLPIVEEHGGYHNREKIYRLMK